MGGQEAISGDAQGRMVMETSPIAAFVVRQTEPLLEFAVVALDPPAHLGDKDQLFRRGLGEGGGEPIFQRLGLPIRLLDQQPLFRAYRGSQVCPMRRADTQASEARGQRCIGTLPPHHVPIQICRQFHGQRFDRDRFMARPATQARRLDAPSRPVPTRPLEAMARHPAPRPSWRVESPTRRAVPTR